MRRPVDNPYWISTEFGVPDSGALFGKHAGVDYAVEVGRSVHAPVSGTVTSYTYGPYHGNVVQIKGDDGRYHRLMHNSRLLVSPGQRVSEGQEVAKSGATGLGVTGPHVHWDVATKQSPQSFGDFISPASVLFADGPHPAPTPAPARQTVTLPKQVKSWAFYSEGSRLRKGTADQIYTLSPAAVGRDLVYDILGWVGDYAVIINSADRGRGVIWVKDTDAIIR
jgi:hypothetical protein